MPTCHGSATLLAREKRGERESLVPDGEAGPGEGVAVSDLCGEPEVAAQGAHLVLVEVPERLHHPPQLTQLPHQLRVVVVGLDTVRVPA